MDILNWLRIKKQNLIRTTLDSPKDLVVLGADVSYQKRGDKYQSYAMPAEDFLATAARPYKVYTALLTQSGGDNIQYINWDDDPNTLTIGVTYTITQNEDNTDFIPVGAPNNNVGTSFVATGTVVNWPTGPSTGNNQLSFNTGAPVVTVLENTIGNIWFTYNAVGNYVANSDDLFTINKTTTAFLPNQYIESPVDIFSYTGYVAGPDIVVINSYFNYSPQDSIYGAYAPNSIEIRVYN